MKNSTLVATRTLARYLSIGLDLGSETSHACVVDRAGEVVERMNFDMSEPGLARALAGYPGAVVLLEACNQSGWVARYLRTLGYHVIVANPRMLKQIAESQCKTDRRDALCLARMARLFQFEPELLRPVMIRTAENELLRSRLVVREQLVRARVRFTTVARTVIRGQGLRVRSVKPDNFPEAARQAGLPPAILEVVEPLLQQVDHLTESIRACERELRVVASEIPVVARLLEIDGVGLMTALSFVFCVEDPRRFEHARDVGPYLGLVPIVRQSSTVERRGRITKGGDTGVRRLLVQASHCLLRAKRSSALRDWGQAVAARRGSKKAVVALARKLATVMHRIWVDDVAYVPFPTNQEAAA